MTERVEPLTAEEIAELRRLSDATGAAEAEAEHLGTNYSNRKAEAAEFHRDKAAGPALARLLDIADDYARLAARCKEHEQFRHQHRDCDKMGCENQALRAQLDAANARIEKLEMVRQQAARYVRAHAGQVVRLQDAATAEAYDEASCALDRALDAVLSEEDGT